MKTRIKELGLGTISLFLFQIVLSIISIKTSIEFLKLKSYTNSSSISSTQLISEILISLLVIISILLITFKKRIGVYIYICSIIASLITSLVFSTFTLENLLMSLIIPGATLALIYVKRKVLYP